MKWLVRIIGSLIAAVIVIILIAVGVVAWDVNLGASATDVTNTEYTLEDGTLLRGYLATPEGEGPFPGVLMVHEWWGINQEIIELADEMAAEGYVVLAPDTYRGAVASTIPGALYLRINIDMQQVDTDMLAAYEYLQSQPQVAENIGVVGFCFGGEVAFNHGRANPEIDAVINLYGSTLADSDAFGALLVEDAPPVLGIFGSEDQGIPLSDVNAYEEALAEAGISYTVSVYDGMGHAFVQPDAINEAGAPQDAWNELLNFFEIHLKSADESA